VARKPEPPPAVAVDIFKAAANAKPLGEVEGWTSERPSKKGAIEFKVPATKLITVQRR